MGTNIRNNVLRGVLLCNSLTGLHLTNKTSKWYIVVFEWFIVAALAFSLTDLCYTAVFTINNLTSFILHTSTIINMINIVIVSFYSLIYKTSINSIINILQKVATNRNFYQYQCNVMNKWKKASYFYLITPLFIFLAVNVISIIGLKDLMESNSISINNTSSVREVLGNTEKEFTSNPKNMLVMTFQIIATSKRFSIDALFLSLLVFLELETKVLNDTLKESLLSGNKSLLKNVNLTTWLQFQHQLAELMAKVNRIWSPIVVCSVTTCTLCLCCLAFAAVKTMHQGTLLIVMLGYWLVQLQPIFFYCYAGHQVMQQGDVVSEAACRAPWSQAHPSVVAGLPLVALDCSRCFVVKGGPFFTLSLEFFASVVGVIITYLIVLLQVK